MSHIVDAQGKGPAGERGRRAAASSSRSRSLGPGAGAGERRLAALATLRRGAAFLAGRAELPWLAAPWPDGADGLVRGRLLANWLRELDGFLHVVLDEVGGPPAAAFDGKRRSVARRIADGNHALDPAVRSQRPRLLALQRSHYTLWHFEGVARRADERGGRWLTCGWPDAGSTALRRVRLGERVTLSGPDLVDVCRFYDGLAERLCGSPAR